MAAHGTQTRPMRRDAVRNHQLVVEAAREVLAEFGTEASVELIASRAGVGVGTVYRRFPNKEALLDEIAGQILSELLDEARVALERGDGTGLEHFLRAMGYSLTKYHAYADKVVGSAKVGCVEQLRDLIEELVAQAQAFHRVSPEITVGDIMSVVWGMRGVVETCGSVAPDAWQRHLDISLAGLRSTEPISDRTPLTREQLTLMKSGRTRK